MTAVLRPHQARGRGWAVLLSTSLPPITVTALAARHDLKQQAVLYIIVTQD
jgi:hypothetical protein